MNTETNNQDLFTHVEASIRTVMRTKAPITAETALIADLGAESIDFLDLSSELERFTGKELDFKEVMKWIAQQAPQSPKDATVGQIVAYLIQERQRTGGNA